MKKLTLPALVFASLLMLVSACKKDDDDNNNNNNQNNPLSTALGGSPEIPTGAAGALYAVNNYVVSDDGFGGTQVDELGTAYAWFDSYVTTKNAGVVSCNSSEIENTFAGTTLPWYYSFGSYIDFSSTNTADWSVEGDAGSGVTGFTHTDNTPFPKCNFTVPASINRNSSLTITSTNVGSNDAVFYTLYGQGTPKVTKSMPANATSATFTAAEVQSVSSSGSMVGIQVMPVKLTPVTKNGKTYYFVKQWAYAQFTTAN
ncbi:MAG TPA: hypothetical protein VK154_02190 [Chitinophagales bacterium]|nr:hypothetical protein [Chitinophagales bacterium]